MDCELCEGADHSSQSRSPRSQFEATRWPPKSSAVDQATGKRRRRYDICTRLGMQYGALKAGQCENHERSDVTEARTKCVNEFAELKKSACMCGSRMRMAVFVIYLWIWRL